MDLFASVKAFLLVADEGGFARAARRMGAATSSVTRQVDALEAYIGSALLNRSTRSVTLTPAGEAYYPQAVRILADLEEARRSIADRDGPPRGLLRVSLPVVFARMHVSPIVAELLATYPELQFEMLMNDDVVNLVESRVDVAVRLGRLDSSSLIARRLAPMRRVLCASPAYVAAHGAPRTPAEVAGHNCLSFAYSSGERAWSFYRDGEHEVVAVQGNLRSNHAETLRQAALAGAGLLLMATWLVGDDLRAGTLVPVLSEWDACPGRDATGARDSGVYAVFLPDRRASRKVHAFIDFLAAKFGDPPVWDRGPVGEP